MDNPFESPTESSAIPRLSTPELRERVGTAKGQAARFRRVGILLFYFGALMWLTFTAQANERQPNQPVTLHVQLVSAANRLSSLCGFIVLCVSTVMYATRRWGWSAVVYVGLPALCLTTILRLLLTLFVDFSYGPIALTISAVLAFSSWTLLTNLGRERYLLLADAKQRESDKHRAYRERIIDDVFDPRQPSEIDAEKRAMRGWLDQL